MKSLLHNIKLIFQVLNINQKFLFNNFFNSNISFVRFDWNWSFIPIINVLLIKKCIEQNLINNYIDFLSNFSELNFTFYFLFP